MTTYLDYSQQSFSKKCHNGNTAVYQEPNGGILYIGGWNQGAWFGWNTHVIDLTGAEHKFWDIPFAYDETSKNFLPFVSQGYKGWLSLPFPDYKTPNIKTREQWEGIAQTIKDILKTGTDVLVACHGGHGRSGLFIAIVGYILAVNIDRSWASPVEHVRKIHCPDAVETFEQEKYVYDILGLPITIKRQYIAPSTSRKFEKCPICGTQSQFIEDFGMCLGCKTKYEKLAPKRHDLTVDEVQSGGLIEHQCSEVNCSGIWTAKGCGHTVHNQIVYEGLCQTCWDKQEAASAALEPVEEDDGVTYSPCALCGQETWYGSRFGICYDCAATTTQNGLVDFVHNSITDPYKAIPHSCDDVGCVGVVVADVCGHVIHNREVVDGKCPECRVEEQKRRNSKL